MKYDIFISYSRKDFHEVDAICKMLKAEIKNIDIWFDINGIESGDEFEDKIISAIDNSEIMLFALSDNSINSKWTKDEVMYAKNTGKRVVPVLLKGAQLKGWFLFKFGRIDCIDLEDELQRNKMIGNFCQWFGLEQQPKQHSRTVVSENRTFVRFDETRLDSMSDSEKIAYLSKWAEQGDAVAQNNLGYSYMHGEGVAKNTVEAAKWYRKAAGQGLAKAQYNLGWMYNRGEGVSKDIGAAIKWYRMAAEQGYVKAQYNLGYMFFYGDGLHRNHAEAIKWYRKAAEQGHPIAIKCLKRLGY